MDRRRLALSAHDRAASVASCLAATPKWNKSSNSQLGRKIGRISWIEHRAARIVKSEWSRLSPSPAARFSNA